MRYLISLLLWVMMATILDAQVPMNWGGKAGMNISQHYGTKGDEGDYKVQTGLRLGAVGDCGWILRQVRCLASVSKLCIP